MRVAILTNDLPSFNKVMAEGLQRMLQGIGVEATLRYDGHDRLRRFDRSSAGLAGSLWQGMNRVSFFATLRGFDVIVLVSTIPKAFLRTDHAHLETLRRWIPGVPIVNYDVIFLPTRPQWVEVLRQGNHPRVRTGDNFGLERFDWYLTVANCSFSPLPKGEWPYTVVGLNLDDGTLYPDQRKEFLALVDFEKPEYLKVRAEQIMALEETSTNYAVLHGGYSVQQIRELYRTASVFFLASPESFGLPICELQACGAYILAPQEDWCPEHWIADGQSSANAAKLSPNFVIYRDRTTLMRELARIRRDHNAQQIVQTFLHHHAQFFFGDSGALASFCDQVRSGAIHSCLHRNHASLLERVRNEAAAKEEGHHLPNGEQALPTSNGR